MWANTGVVKCWRSSLSGKKVNNPDSPIREEDVKPLMEVLKLFVQKNPEVNREDDPKLREDVRGVLQQWIQIVQNRLVYPSVFMSKLWCLELPKGNM